MRPTIALVCYVFYAPALSFHVGTRRTEKLRSSVLSELQGRASNAVKPAVTTNSFPLFYCIDEDFMSAENKRVTADMHRQEWIEKSLSYYMKVMREERRRNLGQAQRYDTAEYKDTFTTLAKKHYFALRKIKIGKWRHAETIYRRIIAELRQDDESCDHAQLAITTLLLALLLQRMGLRKETRSVFLHFFRVAVLEQDQHEECACSAKVLQAYALFEMKQGNSRKSLQLVQKAVQFDPTLEPVLNWKQFRDVLERQSR